MRKLTDQAGLKFMEEMMKTTRQLVQEHAFTLRESLKGSMNTYLLLFLGLLICSPTHAQDRNTHQKEDRNSYKKHVTLWYEAFNKKDPALLDRILSENWVDIPAAADQPAGPDGVKPLLAQLTTTFPDLKLTVKDILQGGDRIIVRAEMAGTQRESFMGFPTKNRRMNI